MLIKRTGFIVVQVLYDIASAIGNAAKMGIAHRDITPNNFGHWQGRGFLYDFSAAKVWSTSANIIADDTDGQCKIKDAEHIELQVLACLPSLWICTV